MMINLVAASPAAMMLPPNAVRRRLSALRNPKPYMHRAWVDTVGIRTDRPFTRRLRQISMRLRSVGQSIFRRPSALQAAKLARRRSPLSPI